MPKMKTNSGSKKRFTLTGTGKIKRKHAFHSHILTKKKMCIRDRYYSESWKDNLFISVGVGAQAGTNPDTKFGKTVTPLINQMCIRDRCMSQPPRRREIRIISVISCFLLNWIINSKQRTK